MAVAPPPARQRRELTSTHVGHMCRIVLEEQLPQVSAHRGRHGGRRCGHTSTSDFHLHRRARSQDLKAAPVPAPATTDRSSRSGTGCSRGTTATRAPTSRPSRDRDPGPCKATLCLTSALARHGLTDEIPAGIDIALPRGQWRPTTRAPTIWHSFNPATFDLGREPLDLTTGTVHRSLQPRTQQHRRIQAAPSRRKRSGDRRPETLAAPAWQPADNAPWTCRPVPRHPTSAAYHPGDTPCLAPGPPAQPRAGAPTSTCRISHASKAAPPTSCTSSTPSKVSLPG